MFGIKHLSDIDRARLAVVNGRLSSGVHFVNQTPVTDDERRALETERTEIQERMKPLDQCSYEELQEVRGQLYEQFLKHQRISSPQAVQIAQYMKQVEFRAAKLLEDTAARDKAIAANPERRKSTRPSRVSTKQSQNSWTVSFDSED